MNDRNKYTEELNRNQKRQKMADDDPHAYAGADENSSDSDDEVSRRTCDDEEYSRRGTFFDIWRILATVLPLFFNDMFHMIELQYRYVLV